MPSATAWTALDTSALVSSPLIWAPIAALPAGWVIARLAARYRDGGWAAPPAPLITVTAAVFLWAAWVAPAGWILALSLGLGWTLLCLAAIDLAAFRLPDVFTLPLLAAGLAASVLLPGRPFLGHLAGAGVGWGLLAALAFGYRRWRGVEGLGLGDAKLLGAAGAWLGVYALPSVVLIAALLALAWALARSLRPGRRAAGEPIAFGAPLALAIWIVWLHGPLAI